MKVYGLKHLQPRCPHKINPEIQKRAAEIDKLQPIMRALLHTYHAKSYAVNVDIENGSTEIKFLRLKRMTTAADNETFYGHKLNSDGSQMQFFKGKNSQSDKREFINSTI